MRKGKKTEEPKEVITHPDGSQRRPDGRYIKPSPNLVTPISKDPVGMQKRGQEIIKQRSIQQARDALDSGAIRAGRMDASLQGSGWGWYAAVEKAAELYFEASSARGAEGLLSLIGRATGNLSDRNEGEKLSGEGITATPAALKELITLFHEEIETRLQQRQAIDTEEV